jgi:gas vesicle protein
MLFQDKLIAYFLVGGFLIGSIFALVKASNKITELKYQNKQLQLQLNECKNTNQELINQVKVQQENLIKAQKELEEAQNKPPKRVYIKQVIKEPVIISNEECQQMVDLINQAQEQLGQ